MEGSNVRGIRGRGGHRGTLVGGSLVHPGAGYLDAHPEGRGHATHVLQGVRPVVRARRRQDAGNLGCAGQDGADVPRLRRDAGLEGGEHLIRGAFLRPGQSRGNRAVGPGYLRDLEDSDVRVGARHVAAGDVEEGVEHRGAQPRGVIRHRVA